MRKPNPITVLLSNCKSRSFLRGDYSWIFEKWYVFYEGNIKGNTFFVHTTRQSANHARAWSALQIMTKQLNTSNLNQSEGNSNADNRGDRHCNQLAQHQVSDFQEVKSKKEKRKIQSSKHTQDQIEGGGSARISRERDQEPESPTPSDTTVIIGDSIIKGL